MKTGADYSMRLVADDGAVLTIDDLVIVDNDGTKTAPASDQPRAPRAGYAPHPRRLLPDDGRRDTPAHCTKAGGAEALREPARLTPDRGARDAGGHRSTARARSAASARRGGRRMAWAPRSEPPDVAGAGHNRRRGRASGGAGRPGAHVIRRARAGGHSSRATSGATSRASGSPGKREGLVGGASTRATTRSPGAGAAPAAGTERRHGHDPSARPGRAPSRRRPGGPWAIPAPSDDSVGSTGRTPASRARSTSGSSSSRPVDTVASTSA